jgi:hypothetical protein
MAPTCYLHGIKYTIPEDKEELERFYIIHQIKMYSSDYKYIQTIIKMDMTSNTTNYSNQVAYGGQSSGGFCSPTSYCNTSSSYPSCR